VSSYNLTKGASTKDSFQSFDKEYDDINIEERKSDDIQEDIIDQGAVSEKYA